MFCGARHINHVRSGKSQHNWMSPTHWSLPGSCIFLEIWMCCQIHALCPVKGGAVQVMLLNTC